MTFVQQEFKWQGRALPKLLKIGFIKLDTCKWAACIKLNLRCPPDVAAARSGSVTAPRDNPLPVQPAECRFSLTAGAATTLQLHTWRKTVFSCLPIITFPTIVLEAGQELLFSKTFMLKTIIKWVKYLHKECYCINQSWWGVQYPCKTQKNTFWNIIITIYITKCIGVLEKTGSFDIITLNWGLILKSCYLWVTGFHPKKSHLVARFLSTRGLLKRSAHVSLDVKFFTVAFQHIL